MGVLTKGMVLVLASDSKRSPTIGNVPIPARRGSTWDALRHPWVLGCPECGENWSVRLLPGKSVRCHCGWGAYLPRFALPEFVDAGAPWAA